jgi:hypothetical protein
MIARSILALSAAALSACAPPAPRTEAARADVTPSGRCERVAARTLAFLGADATDVLEVSASGVDCAKAVVTVSIRPQDGLPVAAFAAPLGQLQAGIDLTKAVTPEAVDGFLKAYAAGVQLDVAASTLPQWKAGVATPGFDEGQELTSPQNRETYEALRKAKPNMLCLMDATDSSACYVWDAKAARAVVILRH